MHDDLNLAKLPQLYDMFKKRGYTKSFNSFLEDLFLLFSTNKELLDLDSNQNLTLKFKPTDEQLLKLINYLDTLNTVTSELEVYENPELDLAKYHLHVLHKWCQANKVKLPNIQTISSFSDLYQSLTSLSTIFLLYD